MIIDEYQLLAVKYRLENNPKYTAAFLLRIIVEELKTQCFSDCGNKEDHFRFNELVTSKKPINEIVIVRGGVTYTFDQDRLILQMFEDTINSWSGGRTKEELDRETEEMFEHFIERTRPLFNKLEYLTARSRHRLIHELLELAGYPFTSRQLQDNDHNKANRIARWLERSSPKLSPETVHLMHEKYPDLNLPEQYPEFFKS